MKKVLALILLLSALCFSQEIKLLKIVNIGNIIGICDKDSITIVKTDRGIFKLCSNAVFIIGEAANLILCSDNKVRFSAISSCKAYCLIEDKNTRLLFR